MATSKKVKNIANISYQYQPDPNVDIIEKASLVSPVADTTITEEANPSVNVVEVSHTNHIKPGDTVNYNLSIVNTGNVSFENLVIKNEGAANLTFTANDIKVYIDGVVVPSGKIVYAAGAFTITPDGGIGEDKEVITIINAKDNGTITTAGTTFTNKISIGYSYKNPLAPDDPVVVVDPVEKLNLITTITFASIVNVTKTMSATPKKANDPMEYTLMLENKGNVDAISAEIKDLLPAEMTYVSVEGKKIAPDGTETELSLTGTLDSATNLLTITGIEVPAGGDVSSTFTNGKARIIIKGTYKG